MVGLGVAAVGQEHVVDSGIDGGDLVREVTPDTLNKTPHPEEDAYSREYRCDGVWSHADSIPARAPGPMPSYTLDAACRSGGFSPTMERVVTKYT